MSGLSLGESQGRPHIGRKMWRRCNDGAGGGLVDLIDVENDTFTNVILIDVPESIPKRKSRGNTAAKKDKRRFPPRNIIFIDDDEISENEYPECSVEDDRQFFDDPSPSMRPCSTSKSAKEPPDEIGDDCQFVRETKPPVKLSKCKRTYSGKASVQNRYGLTSDSESSSSDNDEFMVDYSGQLREQWQKAWSKRKNDCSCQSGFRDINSESVVGIPPEPGGSEEHPACSENSKSSIEKEDPSPESTSRCSPSKAETENDRSQNVSADNGKKCKETDWSYSFHFPKESRHETSSFKEKEGLISGGFPRSTARSSVERFPDCCYSNGSLNPRAASICTRASSGPGISGKKCIDHENGKQFPDRTSKFSAHHYEPQPTNKGSLLEEDEKHGDVNDQDGENVEGCVENCITTERERIKETSEYKKALEEEWASRQRELARQAEEARKLKRLLKRKKAESMRLLEMEKRQKQRLEEMRETQKKDIENMNLKEQIRAEVRKELSKLEMACHDMASVLRGLGIAVGGGTSHEVRVAYKKALLTFHPDRASRCDIQQQVEAEEKFKLISRMKDKYLPALGQ